jgi:Ca-activated chloride channel family protein
MRFAEAQWLWLLAGLPFFAALGLWATLRARRALERFAGGSAHARRFRGEVSPHRRAVKLLLLYLALSCLPIVLARPQWGTRLEPVTRRGADVVIVLDTSLSMSSEDLPPSRLAQAKHAINTLLERIPGDRAALVTFAGQAHLACPLTVDHGAIRLFLDSIDVESVPVPGTALGSALDTAFDAFRIDAGAVDDRGRAIVLLTDGEDHAGELDKVIDEIAGNGVAVFAVGAGTTRGAPIPLRDAGGMLTGYKKDREGRVVTTRLSEPELERIALDTGGRYYRATSSEVEIDEIGQALSALSQGELGSELRTRYEERFQIPLLIGFVALGIEAVLGDRRRRRHDGDEGEAG